MKKYLLTFCAALCVAILVLLGFSGCQNPFQPPQTSESAAPADKDAPANMGYLSLSIGETVSSRTIMPVLPDKENLYYKLDFYKSGQSTVEKPVLVSYSDISTPILLDVGTYDLLVSAYASESRTPGEMTAQSEKITGIGITGGGNTEVSVELKPITASASGGQGTFYWDIEYPASVDTASMTIKELPDGSSTTYYFIGGGSPSKNTTDTLSLDTGSYLVTFNLTNNSGQKIVRNEILHIYQNLVSSYAPTFTDENFFATVIGIKVDSSSKSNYEYGESLSLNIFALYSDGSSSAIFDGEVTITNYSPTTIGSQTVTVTYNADTNIFTTFPVTVNKQTGADVGMPTGTWNLSTQTITVTAVTAGNGQAVQYNISTANDGSGLGIWQDTLTFAITTMDTTYYIYARSKEDATHSEGAAKVSAGIATPTPEAQIVSTGVKYTTLTQALAAAPTGTSVDNPTVITILKDITAVAADNNNYAYTIDANKNIKLTVAAGKSCTITAAPGNFRLFDISNTNSSLTLGPTPDGTTLTLSGNNDETVTPSFNRKGVYVGSNATLTLNNGVTITGFISVYGLGGGVCVWDSSSFTMNGGTIKGNTGNNGGGVCVNDGTFTMKGGNITGNNADYGGGGVSVSDATFTMSGGNISSNNTTHNDGGGVRVNTRGIFTMSSGNITDNNAPAGSGGGVSVNSGDTTFTMSGGTISGNTTDENGGGVYVNGGTFTMNGGTIKGNTGNNGGGVCVMDGGTFTMGGGSIKGNNANYGGGVHATTLYYDNVTTTFTMSGGTIEGNRANSYGGGVYIYIDPSTTGSTTTFTMSGGTIYGTNETDTDLPNTAPSGASFYKASGTAQYNGAYGSDPIDTTNNTIPPPSTITSTTGIVLVKIPGGSFDMGKNSGEFTYYNTITDETPVHTVTLTSGFYMGKYEVTQKQWQDVMGTLPSGINSTYGMGNNYPVYFVDWYDAIEFCNALSIKEGLSPYYSIDKINQDPNNLVYADVKRWTVTFNSGSNGYRLPTEAQWEYAAKGGNQQTAGWVGYTFSGSDTAGDVAWYYSNSSSQSHAVGTKAPNGLGLYDMSGNVAEWCWDWFGSYLSGPQSDPTGALSAESRIKRGGDWTAALSVATSHTRSGDFSYRSDRYTGFRLVRPAE